MDPRAKSQVGSLELTQVSRQKALSAGPWAGYYLTIPLPSGPAIHNWEPIILAPEPGDGG